MKKYNIWLSLCFLLSGQLLFAQYDQLRFKHLNTEDGLSENVINGIYQDSKGFMWFGTNDGLNRYDGYEFKIYQPSTYGEKSISSNLISAITEDAYGRIWVATTGFGVSVLDPDSGEFTTIREEQDLHSDHVVSIYTDSKGRVWIGTLKGVNAAIPDSLNVADSKILSLEIEEDVRLFSINEIIEDRSGQIWLASRSGLYRCNLSANENFSYEKISLRPANEPSVRSLAIDEYGMLMVAGANAIYYQAKHGDEKSFKIFARIGSVQSVKVDKNNRIWLGSYKGLYCYHGKERGAMPVLVDSFITDPLNKHSLSNNLVRSLYLDRSDILWVGTNGGGINYTDPNRKPFLHLAQDLIRDGKTYQDIRSVHEDRYGNVWIGTVGGGLFWYKKEDGKLQNPVPVQTLAKSIFTLEEVEEGGDVWLYIGSEDLPFLQKMKLTEGLPSAAIEVSRGSGSTFSILQDKNKQIWVGTYNSGLHRYRLQEDGNYKVDVYREEDENGIGLSGNIIRNLLEDRKGNIWVGTSHGLNKIPADQTTAETFKVVAYEHNPVNESSLSHNYVLDLHESANGDLWIGTFGGGLNRLVRSDDRGEDYFERFLQEDGLPNNSIKSIEEDVEGNLWLASNRGISRFDPETGTIKNYTINDGLQSSEFYEVASCQLSDGAMIFGGVNGFNYFFPEEIKDRTDLPGLQFTKLWVNNHLVEAGQKVNGRALLSRSIMNTDHLQLKYKENDFMVEFTGIHYSSPDQHKYQYKLEGYHKEWIDSDPNQRRATFTNMPHGSYDLLVRVANSDNVWVKEPAKLHVRIRPPFYLTWYAYLFYAALVVGALLLFHRYTLIGIKEKHSLVLEHMQREKLEELNQMKLNFFTNISHELRTPLTLIINPLEYLLEKGKNLPYEVQQQQHHYMYKNAKYLLRLVNQLLDFRKLDQGRLNLRVGYGNLVNFIRETTEPFQFMATKKEVEFEILDKDTGVYTYFDPDVIEKIMYNLLSNAFKFTPSGGKIHIQCLVKNQEVRPIKGQYLEIRVQDDGPGVARAKIKKIFERFYKEDFSKENKDGAGIGLSYTKSLVELHHGTIDVESVKGYGACFFVRLPMEKSAYLTSEIEQDRLRNYEVESDPLEYMVAEPVTTASAAPPVNMDNELEKREEELPLLLFVDDNADIRRFLRSGFQNDFRIIEAEDGEKGYEIAQASLPDIIVSDVMMPVMNGMEFCGAVKTNPLTSHIPVVLLTAKSTSDDELQGLKTGADAYIMKPFKLEILRAQLLNIYMQRERLKKRFRQDIIMEPKEVTVTSADEQFLKKVVGIIEDHMSDSEFNVEALVKEMFISRSKLYLKLKALTGQSSSEFIRTIRLKRAIQLLEKSDYTIKEIMYMTGFNTASYFSKCFKKQFGMVPSEYLREKNTNAEPDN